MDRLMGFMMALASQTNDDAGDPETMLRAFAALDPDGLKDWAEGFDDLVNATRRSWPSKLLAGDDKRILRDIERIAKGADGATLRVTLPSWVAQRYTMRR